MITKIKLKEANNEMLLTWLIRFLEQLIKKRRMIKLIQLGIKKIKMGIKILKMVLDRDLTTRRSRFRIAITS